MSEYTVKVVSQSEWSVAHRFGEWQATDVLARIVAGGNPMVCVTDDILRWECPGCGHAYAATRGEQPVSGWDNPRWVVTGEGGDISAAPSLGCPNWKAGHCEGHWWLRDGKLVSA